MNIRITIETREDGEEFFEVTTRNADFFGLTLALAMEGHEGAMPCHMTPIGHLAETVCEYEKMSAVDVSKEEQAFREAAALFVSAIRSANAIKHN